MIPRMQQKYREEVAPKIAEQYGVANRLALPVMDKIILNVGMGREVENGKLKPAVRDQVMHDLAVISGQKPVLVKARKSVANFKVREGFLTHAMVTLRRARMWEFFDRLVTLAIPRIKDFRGLSDRSFDKSGNYSFGVGEQGIFPETNMANAQYTHGMNVNVVFRNSDPQKSYFLLSELGFPFRQRES